MSLGPGGLGGGGYDGLGGLRIGGACQMGKWQGL